MSKISTLKLGKLADNIYKQKQKIKKEATLVAKADKKLGGMKEKLKIMEGEMMVGLKINKIKGIIGVHGNCKLSPQFSFVIGHYKNFCAYVKKHDAFELFEKRVSKSAVLDRMASLKGKAANKLLPGLERNEWVTLSVTKAVAK